MQHPACSLSTRPNAFGLCMLLDASGAHTHAQRGCMHGGALAGRVRRPCKRNTEG